MAKFIVNRDCSRKEDITINEYYGQLTYEGVNVAEYAGKDVIEGEFAHSADKYIVSMKGAPEGYPKGTGKQQDRGPYEVLRAKAKRAYVSTPTIFWKGASNAVSDKHDQERHAASFEELVEMKACKGKCWKCLWLSQLHSVPHFWGDDFTVLAMWHDNPGPGCQWERSILHKYFLRKSTKKNPLAVSTPKWLQETAKQYPDWGVPETCQVVEWMLCGENDVTYELHGNGRLIKAWRAGTGAGIEPHLLGAGVFCLDRKGQAAGKGSVDWDFAKTDGAQKVLGVRDTTHQAQCLW